MRQRCRLLGNSSYFNNKQTIGDIVATVKRVAKTKGSNENDSWYEWDIVSRVTNPDVLFRAAGQIA